MEAPMEFKRKLRAFLRKCDPVNWRKVTRKQKDSIIDWYDTSPSGGGNRHRRRFAGSDNDPGCVCVGRDTSFPFATSSSNPALITGESKP